MVWSKLLDKGTVKAADFTTRCPFFIRGIAKKIVSLRIKIKEIKENS